MFRYRAASCVEEIRNTGFRVVYGECLRSTVMVLPTRETMMLLHAIDSVSKISDPEKRLIHVSVARQKNFLRIRIENCYEGEIQFRQGVPVTTKDANYHGFGLKSMQQTVEKYNGSMTIMAKDGWFELRILFPL